MSAVLAGISEANRAFVNAHLESLRLESEDLTRQEEDLRRRAAQRELLDAAVEAQHSHGRPPSMLRGASTVGEWEYDYQGWITKQTLGNEASANYTYDPVTGRLALLDNWAYRVISGQRQEIRLSKFALDDGGESGHNYDARGRLQALWFRIIDIDPYDSASMQDAHDKYGQLTMDAYDPVGGVGAYSRAMQSDARGNIEKFGHEMTGYSGSGYKRNYDQNNQWIGYLSWDSQAETWIPDFGSEYLFAYDVAGNPTTYKGSTIAYDEENRLTSYTPAGQQNLVLTADDRSDRLRAWKADASGNKRFFIYDGDQPVLEVAEDGTSPARRADDLLPVRAWPRSIM